VFDVKDGAKVRHRPVQIASETSSATVTARIDES